MTAILPGERPDPPEDMPADEAEVWRAVVDSMSPDWFRPSIQHLLEQYCHYACKARTTMLQSRRTQDPDTLKKLTVIGAKQTAIMLSFATKLRITVQSSKHRFSAEAATRNTPWKKPWLDDVEST